jgi:hypothetical protein
MRNYSKAFRVVLLKVQKVFLEYANAAGAALRS